MKRKTWIGITAAVLALLIILMPDYLAPICHSHGHGHGVMKCHHMGEANKLVGAIMVGLSLFFLVMKQSIYVRWTSAAIMLLSLLAIANCAWIFGGCASPLMSCNTLNIPATYGASALIFLLHGWYLWMENRHSAGSGRG